MEKDILWGVSDILLRIGTEASVKGDYNLAVAVLNENEKILKRLKEIVFKK